MGAENKTDKATPRPWKLDSYFPHVLDNNATPIIDCFVEGVKKAAETDHANAELIVRAVNNHEKLVAELQKELSWLKHIKPQIKAPESVLLGLDQAIKNITKLLSEVENG